MFVRLARLARNPTVRRVVMWLVPILMTWILNKIDESEKKNQTKKKK